MVPVSLKTCAPGTPLAADVCVVGSGPAGAAIALALAGSSLRVMLLESGDDGVPIVSSPLDDIESTGVPRVLDQAKLRARTPGGTSAIWSGRCVTFDDIDFARREWVPHSGWPVTRGGLEPWLDKAGRLMRLGPNRYDDSLWPLLSAAKPTPPLDERKVVSSFWQYSLDPADATRFLHFGHDLAAVADGNVTLVTGATATHIDTDGTGTRVTGLEVADAAGRRFTVTAGAYVLAAGGIENPRLLLASDRVVPGGVGNARDQVGRYLMDHPRCTIAEFDPGDVDDVLARFGIYQLHADGKSYPYSHGLALSPALQQSEGLLNCAAWLTEYRSDDDPWEAIKRLKNGTNGRSPRDVARVLKHPRLLARGLRRRLLQGRGVIHKLDRLLLDCIVEQRPDPDSRLTLSARRDPLGVPLPSLRWQISEQEKRTVARLGHEIVAELKCLGLPTPALVPWVADNDLDAAVFRDVAHPTGTTRMSAAPDAGVVDTDCRVHGVDNLYVAGSSVFPTAGHGNPTLMIVGLALRLADHLARTLATPRQRPVPSPGMAGKGLG